LLFRGILFFSKAWWTSDWLVQNLVLLSREKECIHHFFDLWQSSLSLIANLWFKGTSVPDSITISCDSESWKSSLVAALLSIGPDSKHNLSFSLSLSCPRVLWIVNIEA
jgi:hypothetical protein